MTSHFRYHRFLSTYVDGELPASHIRRIEEHLAGCGECRLQLQNLRKLQGLLRQGLQEAGPEVLPGLWPGVWARIKSGRPEGLLQAWVRQVWEAACARLSLSLTGAALVTCLIVLAGYLLWEAPVGRQPVQILPSELTEGGVVVEIVEPEPGFRAMVLTTSGQGLKVIWVIPGERT
ncbi:MAG: anti-sigma factor family protein [Candidatus Methylomirabilales bacterium]